MPDRVAQQFARFCTVGAASYVLNVVVYSLAVAAGSPFALAALVSFSVAVSANYVLHRSWTFADVEGTPARQAPRFLVVSLTALGTNELALAGLVDGGVGKIAAQAAACVLAMPVSFAGNRLWAFRPS